jgi:hypothetical protein
MDPPSPYCTGLRQKYAQYAKHAQYAQYAQYAKPCCWRGCVVALANVKYEMAAQMIAADTEPALTHHEMEPNF